jgi:signal transduction histidine kinase
LREQWIFAALMGLVWCGDTLLIIDRDDTELLLIPGATLMSVLALTARRYPVHSGLIAACAMAISTLVAHAVGAKPHSFGLHTVLPAENAAGLLLVLYVFWKRPLGRAIPVAAALVISCLLAVFARASVSFVFPPAGFTQAVGFGFLQLILATGTGLYLRGRRPQAADTPLRALLRRQWPAMAALCVFLFLELLTFADELPGGMLPLLGCVIMAGLAVIAPVRPVETAMLGALTLALLAAVMRVLSIPGKGFFILGPIPLTTTAAGMLLVAFAIRHAESRKALWSSAALVVSALFALVAIPSESPRTRLSDLPTPLFMGGLLLVLSVGTGMYFRARDAERAKSVDAAVSHAQQTERMALARELHDVVAHHVTGIVVQAQAAHMVAANNPQAATEALERIAGSGTDALAAMRRLVSSMRGAEPAGASGATEQATTDLKADLEAIVAHADRVVTEHGHPPRVELGVDLGRDIPQEVARSALRVVQESLTNAEKHAVDATRIQVAVNTTTHHNLHVRITDDGSTMRAQPVGGSGGYGLVGMRERIELLGGRFNAGPGDHIGWRVEAWLPLGEREQGENAR